jgi:hypothetical protein
VALTVAPPLLNGDGETRGRRQVMKITTQPKAGGSTANHNEALRVRTALKAGFKVEEGE